MILSNTKVIKCYLPLNSDESQSTRPKLKRPLLFTFPAAWVYTDPLKCNHTRTRRQAHTHEHRLFDSLHFFFLSNWLSTVTGPPQPCSPFQIIPPLNNHQQLGRPVQWLGQQGGKTRIFWRLIFPDSLISSSDPKTIDSTAVQERNNIFQNRSHYWLIVGSKIMLFFPLSSIKDWMKAGCHLLSCSHGQKVS